MYDDLFGDLPQAKGAQKNSTNSDESKANNNGGSGDNSIIIPSKVEHQQQKRGETSSNVKNDGDQSKTATKPKSIVESLGNAGTTVSFVPLALKRRKRPNPGNSGTRTSTLSKKRQTSTSLPSASKVDSAEETAKKSSNDIVHQIKPDPEENSNSNNNIVESQSSTIITETGTTTITTQKKLLNDQPLVLNPHQIPDTNTKSTSKDNADDDEDQILLTDDEDVYVESEELQKLHVSIHPYDMYDPLEPNDYLTYKQKKDNENLRKDLERQAKKTLELQKQLRNHIEEERKKVLDSGDVNKIIESRIDGGAVGVGGGMGRGRGRGRGRGLTNLPAWLVKKQQEQKESSSASSPRINQHEGQFDDANVHINKQGSTVVLSNMVGPDEVDDELKDEVKEECESKCGKVINVRIDVSGGEVKVYVTFQNEGAAKEAPRIFHGRMFGQRQIKAHLL